MLATETIKVLLGIESGLNGKLWVYDGQAGTSKTLSIPKLDDCPVCCRPIEFRLEAGFDEDDVTLTVHRDDD